MPHLIEFTGQQTLYNIKHNLQQFKVYIFVVWVKYVKWTEVNMETHIYFCNMKIESMKEQVVVLSLQKETCSTHQVVF